MSAIPFIVLDDATGQYTVQKEAVAFLSSLGGPLGIVSIAGRYRTGKSTFLNKVLLGDSAPSGFGVGSSVNACTKGIWVYKRAFQFSGENGPMQVVVIDSEGIGSMDADQTHDCRIFSLLLLLSSFFVYNSVGCIDDQALKTLSLVAEVSKQVRVRSTCENSTEDLSGVFPTFCWVVRDFTLSLEDRNGAPITADAYLEQSLVSGSGECPVRDTIRTCFPDRMCTTMVRPCQDEDDLRELVPANTRPAFQRQCTQIRSTIFRRVKPKTYMGTPVSGAMLVTLAGSYADSINRGAAPVIQDSWALIAGVQSTETALACVAAYQEQLRSLESVPGGAHSLVESVLGVFEASLRSYRETAMDTSEGKMAALAASLRGATADILVARDSDARTAAERRVVDLSRLAADCGTFRELRTLIESRPTPSVHCTAMLLQRVWDWIDAKVATLETEHRASTDRLAEFRGEVETVRAQSATQASDLETLRAGAAAADTQIQEQKTEVAALLLRETDLAAQLADAVEAQDHLQDMVTSMEQRLAESSTTHLTLQNTTQQLQAVQERNRELTECLERRRTEFAESLDSLQAASLASVERVRGDLDTARRERNDEKERRETLEVTHAEDLGALQRLQASAAREAEAARVSHENRVEELTATVTRLQHDLAATRVTIKTGTADLATLREQLDRVSARSRALETESACKVLELDSCKRKITDMEERVEDRKRLKQEMHTVRSDLVKFQHVAEWLEKDKQVRDDKIRELGHDLSLSHQRCNELSHKHDMELLRLRLNTNQSSAE